MSAKARSEAVRFKFAWKSSLREGWESSFESSASFQANQSSFTGSCCYGALAHAPRLELPTSECTPKMLQHLAVLVAHACCIRLHASAHRALGHGGGCWAGWWVGSQRLSVTNLTGIAAGIGAMAGLGDLLSLVLWHPHSSTLPTLLWAAVGAALAHLAWRFQMSLSHGNHKAGKEGIRASGSGTSLAAQAAADTAWPRASSMVR